MSALRYDGLWDPMLTTVLALLTGKLTHAVACILYRLASWTGSLALWRQGKKSGSKAYYAAAVAVYVVSWLLVILVARGAWSWIHPKAG